MRPGPTARACRARRSSTRSTPACDASAPITWTCTRSTAGIRHADRGDAGGAARRRQGGQGALHRRLVHVRLAVRQGALHVAGCTAGPNSSACRTTSTCSTARRSARCCRSAGTRASRSCPGARWPAAGSRGRGTRRLRPETDEFGKTLYRDADRGIVDAVGRIAAARGVRGPRSRWLAAAEAGGHGPDHRRIEAAPSDRRGGGAGPQAEPEEIAALEAPYVPRRAGAYIE